MKRNSFLSGNPFDELCYLLEAGCAIIVFEFLERSNYLAILILHEELSTIFSQHKSFVKFCAIPMLKLQEVNEFRKNW